MARLVAVLLLSFPAGLAAAQGPSLSLPAQLDAIVVTATRWPQPWREVPARLEVLDAAEVRRSGTESVDRALAQVAGVNSRRANGINSFNAGISLRGAPSGEQGRTLILVDGVPVNASATGMVDFNRIDLAEVERVEAQKGPGSYMHGAGALFGTVQIITRRPKEPLEVRTAASYGSYDTRSFKASASGRAGLGEGSFFWRLSGLAFESGGYVSTPEADRTAHTAPRYTRQRSLGGRFGWEGAGQDVEFEYGRFDDRRGEGVRIIADDGSSRSHDADFWRLSWKGKVAGHAWRLDSHLQRQDYGRITEKMKGAVYQRVDVIGDRADAGIALGWSPPSFLGQSFSFGLDLRYGKVDSQDHDRTAPYSSIANRGRMRLLSFHLQDEASLGTDKLKAFAAVRLDQAAFRDGLYDNPTHPGWGGFNGPLESRSWHAWTGKAGVRYLPTPRWSIYASYGRGFRAPTLEDMCLSLQRGRRVVLGNPGLSPETLDSYELGADWLEGSWLRVSPSVFYSQGRDFIYSVDTGDTVNINGVKPVYQRQNVARVELYGVELDARLFPAQGVSFAAGLAAHRSRIERFDRDPSLEGKTLAYAPFHQVTLSGEWDHPWLGMALWWTYKDKQYLDDANGLTGPSHAVLNVRLWKDVGRGFRLSFVVENLGDLRRQEDPDDLAPGRTVRGIVEARF